MESGKDGEVVVAIRHLIEWSALGIEVLAALIAVRGI